MVLLPAGEKVLYYEIRGTRYLFADERVKMHLVYLMDELHQRDGWHLLAFCIMDDCAYFIIESAHINGFARSIMDAVRDRLADVFHEVGIRSAATAILTTKTERLKSYPEIVDRCRKIHRIPLESGKVDRLKDYWWSSYPSYARVHEWELVDQSTLLLYFSEDRKTAYSEFIRLHEGERE